MSGFTGYSRSNLFALGMMVLLSVISLHADSLGGMVHGITKNAAGQPVAGVQILARNLDDQTDRRAVSSADGRFVVDNLKPGRYEISATLASLKAALPGATELAAGQDRGLDLILTGTDPAVAPVTNVAHSGSFLNRLVKAYADDWNNVAANGPVPPYRGYEAPESNPPFPFTVWPYGGSPVIGQPNTMSPPVMNALYAGPHGEAWQHSKIQVYGWLSGGFNISSSNHGGLANAPAAYYVYPNSLQLDQATLYVERVPDTVQTDHIDWGFRFTALYGMDYRFTTSKGILSSQLLDNNSRYGFDPVMAYFDIYIPQIGQGTNIRIGRYVSLPDIEAQLAPNNYTYSHSITYTYDCYTQQGINVTTRLSSHWMMQVGLSAGCDASLWTQDAKATGNFCLSYTWSGGGDNLYACANSINSSKYAYNNLAAYYLTWYHKINDKWHTDTESWYQYMRDVPSIFGSIPAEKGSNGAWCNPGQQSCFAPEWAIVNYVERQVGKRNYISIRNEYFDDIKGQRTGYKTRYSEHLLGWGHWIGSTILLRPEISYLRAYNYPAFDAGAKKNQTMLAGDVIWFY